MEGWLRRQQAGSPGDTIAAFVDDAAESPEVGSHELFTSGGVWATSAPWGQAMLQMSPETKQRLQAVRTDRLMNDLASSPGSVDEEFQPTQVVSLPIPATRPPPLPGDAGEQHSPTTPVETDAAAPYLSYEELAKNNLTDESCSVTSPAGSREVSPSSVKSRQKPAPSGSKARCGARRGSKASVVDRNTSRCRRRCRSRSTVRSTPSPSGSRRSSPSNRASSRGHSEESRVQRSRGSRGRGPRPRSNGRCRGTQGSARARSRSQRSRASRRRRSRRSNKSKRWSTSQSARSCRRRSRERPKGRKGTPAESA